MPRKDIKGESWEGEEGGKQEEGKRIEALSPNELA